jgi:parallel beta helix pectate lyase-like protein
MKPALIHWMLALALSAATARASITLYVSRDGDDAWSGKSADANAAKTDGPFATLERARDEARKLKQTPDAKGGITVSVRGGTYWLANTLKLGPEDSGTADSPVVYAAYQNEKPALIGGRQITGFSVYKDRILKTDVGAQGFKGVYFRHLFFNGKRQQLARYPNFDPQNPYGGGWAYADGDPVPIYQDVPDEDKHTLVYKAADARNWSHPEDGEVFVFPRYNWWNNIVRIKSVDRDKRTIALAGDASYAIRPHDRYYVRNLLEELDAPGEWYLDRQTWTLYFWPAEDPNKERRFPTAEGAWKAPLLDDLVYAPTVRTIVELQPGAAFITIRGFTIECADESAVSLKQTSNCLVAGNTIRNVSGYSGSAVSVNEGKQNGVVENDIYDVGNTGISLSGGDRKTLTPAGNYADNNYIHHVGVFHKQGVGIGMSGVGNRASHNLIHDCPRFAIMFGGNNQVIEYNHLRHLALETEDVGATYCGGRDWITPRGSLIRYNFIHDVLGYGRVDFGHETKWLSPYFAWGIYLDDNSGGVDVIGNIVARCGRALLHGHSARDCVVENNIFIEGAREQWEFNGWTAQTQAWKGNFDKMVQAYESVAHEPAWQNVRGMKLHPKDAPDSEGRVMCGDVFTRNIISWMKPDARALHVAAFNGERNQFDHNLYWHHGQPLLTDVRKPGKTLGGNLAPNPGFEEGEIGKMPKDWSWQIRPRADASAVVAQDGDRKCMRIDAARVNDKPRDNYPIIVSRELELKLGATYRLRAKMRSDQENAKASLMIQCWIPPGGATLLSPKSAATGVSPLQGGAQKAHFWASSPSDAKLTTAWKDYEFVFKIPAPSERGWHEKMKTFRVRIDWPAETGSLFADDVALEELETLDEWASWQALGGDRHSIIADPKFLDPAHDDYRLAPDSPAWKLGFKPIPVEKIGPYKDPLRASWPIVEAEGAREKPLVSD